MAQVADFFKRLALLFPGFGRKNTGGKNGLRGGMARDPVRLQDFRVSYRDVDMNGEMFRSAYVSLAEQAVAEFWSRRKPRKDDPFFVVSRITCHYHLPLRLNDAVHLHVGVSKIGGKSAGFLVHFMRGTEAAAEAEILWAASTPETHQPAQLPEELRDWLYQFLD